MNIEHGQLENLHFNDGRFDTSQLADSVFI